MKKVKKKENIKRKTKVWVVILIVLLVIVFLTGLRELNRVIHVANITKIDSEDRDCPSVITMVYVDFFNKYYQSNGCTNYVYYKNGTKESLSVALYLHHLDINDLERLEFSLMKSKKLGNSNQGAEIVGKKHDYSKDDDAYVISEISATNTTDECLDMIDVFYSDNKYDYSFSCLNGNITVNYANGKTEENHEAFKNKHVTIKDLDKFNIKYEKLERPVTVKTINSLVSNNGCNLEKTNIYSDDNYNYYIKNTCYTVIFSDGSKEPIEQAFQNQKITIYDLERLNFSYTKEPK